MGQLSCLLTGAALNIHLAYLRAQGLPVTLPGPWLGCSASKLAEQPAFGPSPHACTARQW